MTEVANDEATLRAAIVGYGLAGSVFHAPLIAATPGMRVAAIVTRDPRRRAQAEHDFPEAQILYGADDVWAHASEFDLAVIATPNRWHVPLGLAAIEAGLPVAIDKPIAASLQGA
ncbi:MAG TPA: Gfo/Idh/MocA family oxidoreductase, partial [Chloroflexota bacterium]